VDSYPFRFGSIHRRIRPDSPQDRECRADSGSERGSRWPGQSTGASGSRAVPAPPQAISRPMGAPSTSRAPSSVRVAASPAATPQGPAAWSREVRRGTAAGRIPPRTDAVALRDSAAAGPDASGVVIPLPHAEPSRAGAAPVPPRSSSRPPPWRTAPASAGSWPRPVRVRRVLRRPSPLQPAPEHRGDPRSSS
jgi:hypothetical protein